MGALTSVAKPELHLVRGVNIAETVREALLAKNVPAAFGEWLFGYVKERLPAPRSGDGHPGHRQVDVHTW